MVLSQSDSWSNWNLEILVCKGGVGTRVPGEKPLGAKERINNTLNPHMVDTRI